MITIRYWELVLIFLAGIGFWHLAMGVIYPWYGAKMDLKIAREKAKIAEYEAACASSPPMAEPTAEPTVEIQVIEVVQPSVLDRTHYHALTAPTFDMALLNWEPWSSGWVGETTGMQPVIEEAATSEASAELVEVS